MPAFHVASPFMLAGLLAVATTAAACDVKPAPRQRSALPPAEDERRVRDCEEIESLIRRMRRGYVPFASPDVLLVPREPNYVGTPAAPVHNGPWDYLVHVPFIAYGPPFIRRDVKVQDPATIADLAPTIARIIDFDELPRRDGDTLREAIATTRKLPRLVVTVVWDGGGWNVLNEHPDAFPFLRSLMRDGTTYTKMTVASSPSVTAPIHTTLGTGAFPKAHGIPDLKIRTSQGSRVDPMLFIDPSRIRVPTLADLYGRSTRNEAVTGMLASANWHIGMIGHGASIPGSDRDPVVLIDEDGVAYTNEALFSLPPVADPARLETLLAALDRRDGEADAAWRGTSLDGGDSTSDIQARKGNPARVAYKEAVLEQLIRHARFGEDTVTDLLFVNFKSADEAGHRWGMTSERVSTVLRAQDRALRRLVRFLDIEVGRRAWALFVTADHGQTPFPHETGAWPISGRELEHDVNRRFDRIDNGVPVADEVVAAGLYVHRQEAARNGVSTRQLARWIIDYSVRQNLGGSEVPSGWEQRLDEALFNATIVGRSRSFRSCG